MNRYLLSLSLLLSLLAWSAPPVSAAPGAPLPLDSYWNQIEKTQSVLRHLRGLIPEVARPARLRLANVWEETTAVALPDGTTVPLDHGFLVAQLRREPPDYDRLDELLTTITKAREDDSNALPGDAVERLKVILNRPEFQWAEESPSPLRKFLQKLWQEVFDFLDALLGSTAQPMQYGGYVLGILLIVVLLGVLAYVSRELFSGWVEETDLNPRGDDVANLTAATAAEQAKKLSSGGDYRSAVRYLYLATLLTLEERGWLHYDRALTNREYAQRLVHQPRLAAVFRDVVDVFDRVWYGKESISPDEYHQYAAQVHALEHYR